jgi:hypothetical protein
MVSRPTALSTGRHTGSERGCRGVWRCRPVQNAPVVATAQNGQAVHTCAIQSNSRTTAPRYSRPTKLIGSDCEAVRLAPLPAFLLYAGCCFPSTQPWKSGASFLPRARRTPTTAVRKEWA